MPSDKPDKVEKWRHPLSAVQTLEADAFAEMVLENGLRVVGPYRGYVYAALERDDGFDMFKAYQSKKWLWQSRIVFTQTNAAGGAIVADYTVASGQIAQIVSVKGVNSGTNTLGIRIMDEDNAEVVPMAYVGSAASNSLNIPSIGQAATGSANIVQSLDMIIGPGQKLSVYQGAAGAQNDTMTVSVVLWLFNLATEPTISKARSTNAADVTQGADSISDANDLQEFVC